jgi:hypothetical protein
MKKNSPHCLFCNSVTDSHTLAMEIYFCIDSNCICRGKLDVDFLVALPCSIVTFEMGED